jgi:hypothetical protein
MPRQPVPLSATVSRSIKEATTFLNEVPYILDAYHEGSNINEIQELVSKFHDMMIALMTALLRSLPEEEFAPTVIDVPLTLELRMAIAQAAEVHRLLSPMLEITDEIPGVLQRWIGGEDNRNEWEPFGARILELRCEVLKFLSFAFPQNQ